MFLRQTCSYRSCVLGLTRDLTSSNQRSRNCATVVLFGSRYVPRCISEIRRAHSICACRFVPANECHRRFRLPVAGSRTSSTMPQCPGERSRRCPFIFASLPFGGGFPSGGFRNFGVVALYDRKSFWPALLGVRLPPAGSIDRVLPTRHRFG